MKIDKSQFIDFSDLMNKLFCTFTEKEELNNTLEEIQSRYTLIFSKIFILESPDTPELICTYNVDTNNLNDNAMMNDTIMLHRHRETNTLYTINSLNALIASLNGGKLDKNYQITWKDYKNSILLTRDGEFFKINTKINSIKIGRAHV